MRQGFTLIETIIALTIAVIIFMTIFRLTDVSFRESITNIGLSRQIISELNEGTKYELNILKNKPSAFNIKSDKTLVHAGYTEYQSKLGYTGWLINEK